MPQGATRTDVHPNDLAVFDGYNETYEYDAVGNFIAMAHAVPSDTTHSWTRHYVYGGIGNRLMQTHGGSTIGPGVFNYSYDEHGSMLAMPRLAVTYWNSYDELARTDNGGGDGRIEHHFQYDAQRQRVRKVIEHHGLDEADEPIITLVEERLYLDGYEVYRRHVGADLGAIADIETQTFHVMDNEERVALLDTRTVEMAPEDVVPEVITVGERETKRTYQMGNHIGSACLETDEDGELVRYEEFHPLGSCAMLYARSGLGDEPKRYRFTGMERDETGLQYHLERYYSAWLGRWLSCDPAGLEAGVNSALYGSPIHLADRSGRQPRPAQPSRDTTASLIRVPGEGRGAETSFFASVQQTTSQNQTNLTISVPFSIMFDASDGLTGEEQRQFERQFQDVLTRRMNRTFVVNDGGTTRTIQLSWNISTEARTVSIPPGPLSRSDRGLLREFDQNERYRRNSVVVSSRVHPEETTFRAVFLRPDSNTSRTTSEIVIVPPSTRAQLRGEGPQPVITRRAVIPTVHEFIVHAFGGWRDRVEDSARIPPSVGRGPHDDIRRIGNDLRALDLFQPLLNGLLRAANPNRGADVRILSNRGLRQ